MFDVYLITDAGPPANVLDRMERALEGHGPARGRLAVQVRAKERAASERHELARALRLLTRRTDVPLLVNGDIDLAREIDAEGVHLPEHGPIAEARRTLSAAAVIGVSCHRVEGLRRAAAEGASFATLSPVFDVPGKAPALGIERFAELVRDASLPVLALGGVRRVHVDALIEGGAHGVAVIREVLDAAAPSHALHNLLDAVAAARTRKFDRTRPEGRF